ncbi:MAG: hypothetical protein GX456_01550 [Verrucomicrobia bacterium]|nr:hypothetical protein [Verrucomicrobiota bacterium]
MNVPRQTTWLFSTESLYRPAATHIDRARLDGSRGLAVLCQANAARISLSVLLLTTMPVASPNLAAADAARGAFQQCHAWVERAFGSATPAPGANLKLLYQDAADGVSRGKSWRGTPFQIGSKTYSHGLAFNSTKHIQVNLPGPGKRFIADVGLENNDDTRRGAAMGNGSVTFHVLVNGKEMAASPVMRLKDEPMHFDVDLNGERAFEIRIKDGGDGRGWDQGLWAEATVELTDGTVLRLQDLPWTDVAAYNPNVISWKLDGQPSTSFLARWQRQAAAPENLPDRALHRVKYSDPSTGLEFTVEAEVFKDFPAAEWVVRAANRGATNSPLIENLLPLDAALLAPATGNALLHWARGAVASFDDFAPQQTEIKADTKLHLQPGGGRSSSQVLPFFNLAGDGGGIVIGIGWSGEWAADFNGAGQGVAITKIGMANTRLRLFPQEEIRTPRILLLFYEGDRWSGQNLLRRFILAHHRPKKNGKPMVSPITCGNWGGTRAEVHMDNIRKIIAHDLPIEYYWIDAEWYGRSGPAGSWAVNVGNWSVKKDLYPDGFKPLSTALRQSGRELMLWFEPERVFKDTPWRAELRDWLIDIGHDSALFNLGNPEARKFLTDFISSRIDEFGLGCYRQDFNMDPMPFWQAADAPDRNGMSEIRHIEGLYEFWDELLARHPNLLIDNCASGGRRIDLETVGRATPFWRTDGPRDPIAHQCHTYGLLAWVPFSSTSQDTAGDDYEFRSSMCSSLCLNWWVHGDAPAESIPENFPFDWAKRTLAQYLQIRHFYEGDYYPLTSYSQAPDLWMAYQLDRPDLAEGIVVALRRPASQFEAARFTLRGLDPKARYLVTDLDSGKTEELTGEYLANTGLRVAIQSKPGSALLRYKRQSN